MANKGEYDYVFSSVLLRSKEVQLLNRADLERIAGQKDIGSAMRVLTEFGYGDAKTETGAGSADEMLTNSLDEAYALVFSILPDEPEMKLFLYPNDYHNAKVLLKAEALKLDPAPFLIEAATIPPAKMEEAVRKRDFASLSSYMKQAIHQAAESFAKSRDPQEIDITLDIACYGDMLSEAGKLGNDFVMGYVKLLIDILNMSTFIRLRKIGKSRNFFGKIFLEGGNVDKGFFAGAYEEAYSTIADKLQPYGYYEVFAAGAEEVRQTGNFALLEKLLDDLKIKFAKECKYRSFGLDVAAAYLIAKETEVKNLRIIFAGIAAGTDLKVIAERLRETYV